MNKICTSCRIKKSFDMFGPRKRGRDGLSAKCRECVNIESYAIRQKKHKEYCSSPRALTQEQALHFFDYVDGKLFWKNPTQSKVLVGAEAGFVNNVGYIQVSIFGKKYRAHQIVFLMHNGHIPKEIDHINCNRTDNRIENLREVTRVQNMYNKPVYKSNTSGAKGVSWKANLNKWQVFINVNKQKKYLGVYEDFELAELVAIEARNKYHGTYANNGLGV